MVELMNLKESSEFLRLSIFTLRAWIYANRIPYVRLGRRILLRRQDLERLIERSVVEPKQAREARA
jgi:excisionase family DNA binding protein